MLKKLKKKTRKAIGKKYRRKLGKDIRKKFERKSSKGRANGSNKKENMPEKNKNSKADSVPENETERATAFDRTLKALESVLVLVAFLLFNSIFGLTYAIAISTLVSLWFLYSRYKRGIDIGKFLPILALLIVFRGFLGVLFNSATIYFRVSFIQGALVGVVLIVSAALNRNLLTVAAPYLFDFTQETQKHPIYQTTMRTLAILIGAYFILKAALDSWLLDTLVDSADNSGANAFLGIRTLIGFPLAAAVFLGCVGFAAKRFAAIPEFEGFASLMERQAAIYKGALGERSKTIKEKMKDKKEKARQMLKTRKKTEQE